MLAPTQDFFHLGGCALQIWCSRGYVLTLCWESWILWWIRSKPFFSQAIWFWQKKQTAKNPDRHWLIKPHSFPRPLLIKLQELIQKWKISGPATQHGYHPQITPKSCFFVQFLDPTDLLTFRSKHMQRDKVATTKRVWRSKMVKNASLGYPPGRNRLAAIPVELLISLGGFSPISQAFGAGKHPLQNNRKKTSKTM